MKKHHALIIDDEPDIRELLEITLQRMDIDCSCAENLQEAKQLLKENDFNICLTDMRLPDGDGVDFVSYIQSNFPNIPVAVITAHGNMETAISAMKYGAFDFLTKPVDLSLLRNLVDNALKLSAEKSHTESKLIGDSSAIRNIRKTVVKLAKSQAPIYISGETGVGKEMVALMIHEQSPRSVNSFVPVNCGAIPAELMESEFFGHKKGSFTGAVQDKKGFFQAAEGGTLFLDEVAELPLNMQVKLLRVIQEKKIRPVGEQNETPVNVRLLCATHKNLSELVKKGDFRHDLFYRINVIELNVIPLRERREDINSLIEYFLIKISGDAGMQRPKISGEAIKFLMQYDFPGNVRELENMLERALALSDGKMITADDLQFPQAGLKTDTDTGIDITAKLPLDAYLSDIEHNTILAALEKTRWNKTAAAKLLGISFRALRYKLEKLGLN